MRGKLLRQKIEETKRDQMFMDLDTGNPVKNYRQTAKLQGSHIGGSRTVEERIEELVKAIKENNWIRGDKGQDHEDQIDKVKINKKEAYKVVEDLYSRKADIPVGQLLDIAPALRSMLKQGISRGDRIQWVILAKTSNTMKNNKDHILEVLIEGVVSRPKGSETIDGK